MDEIIIDSAPSMQTPRDVSEDLDYLGSKNGRDAVLPSSSATSIRGASADSEVPSSSFRQYYPPEQLDTEFKRRYPPDPFGKEMAPTARVWKVFRDEASVQDDAMLDGWNKTLDILLIFAGLFSGVATAFILDSYKSLQPDFAQYTARALYILVSARNDSGFDSMGVLSDPSVVDVTVQARWINGLWFTSLCISLAVALLCILVKQCLVQYHDRTTRSCESPQYWARRRSFYFSGLQKWHVHTIISVLPLLMHLSLFLFLTGLVALLQGLDSTIALVIAVLTAALASFYAICTFLPLWWLDFPLSTPLLGYALSLGIVVIRLVSHVMAAALAYYTVADKSLLRDSIANMHLVVRKVWSYASSFWIATIRFTRCFKSDLPDWSDTWSQLMFDLSLYFFDLKSVKPPSADPRFRDSRGSQLDAVSLNWMFCSCSDPDVLAVACDATGALNPSSHTAVVLQRGGHATTAIWRSIVARVDQPPLRTLAEAKADAAQAARLARAVLSQSYHSGGLVHWYPTLATHWTRTMQTYDLPLLTIFFSDNQYHEVVVSDQRVRDAISTWTEAGTREPGSRTLLTSTVLQILGLHGLSLYNRVMITSLMHFDELTPEDVDQIARPIYNECPSLSASHAGSDVPHAACSLSCAVELFCQLVLSADDFGLDHTARRTAVYIVRQLVVTTSRRGSGEHGRSPSAFGQFYHLIGSDLFEEIVHSPQDTEAVITFLTQTKRGVAGISQTRAMHFMSGMVHLLELTRLLGGPHPRQGVLSLAAGIIESAFLPPNGRHVTHVRPPWTSCDAGTYDVDPNNQGRLSQSLLLSGPVALLRRDDSGSSLWQFIVQEYSELDYTAMTLVRVLSAHLCAYSRQFPGIDLSSLIDDFFDHEWGLKFIRAASTQHRINTVFIEIAQHCIELKPGWWTTLLLRAEGLENNEHHRKMRSNATWLDVGLRANGGIQRCTTCVPMDGLPTKLVL